MKAEIGIAGLVKAAVDFVMENIKDENKEANTGDCSASTNTGNYSKADVSGKESVAAALGIESKAKGVLGCWLVLAEWAKDENYNWHRKDVQCFKVDGVTVKPDTWYKLKTATLWRCPND